MNSYDEWLSDNRRFVESEFCAELFDEFNQFAKEQYREYCEADDSRDHPPRS